MMIKRNLIPIWLYILIQYLLLYTYSIPLFLSNYTGRPIKSDQNFHTQIHCLENIKNARKTSLMRPIVFQKNAKEKCTVSYPVEGKIFYWNMNINIWIYLCRKMFKMFIVDISACMFSSCNDCLYLLQMSVVHKSVHSMTRRN